MPNDERKVGKDASQFKVDMENGGGKSQLKMYCVFLFKNEKGDFVCCNKKDWIDDAVTIQKKNNSELPASFPEEPPKMSVNPDEFNNHPLVNPQTVEVRYEKIGVNWTQGPVLLANVVKRVVDEFERSSISGLLSMLQQDDLKDQENSKS
ncbi:hypothetical protein RFI_19252 [Reticulomyxa filosa]|uniref:Uncharacterized protein n=1 Tax=Reticulomyxa filosa TaxID=46433 RepID=X6MX39_RETFI|nr:hypothetical protein RFI_19252 [Reticulomyxa filosa]|eukprot:ETO18042.1 hypothetical protein RFI_19252 [Reticulomyxa filosa]